MTVLSYSGQDDVEAGYKAVHIVAEGMIPKDTRSDGTIDPDKTSARALEEVLNVSGNESAIGHVKASAMTGFFFDRQRLQPCFSYIAHLGIDVDQLCSGIGTARDSWEVEGLKFIQFSADNAEIIALLRDNHPSMRLASNQARAVLWFACLYEFGYLNMRDYLNMPESYFKVSEARTCRGIPLGKDPA